MSEKLKPCEFIAHCEKKYGWMLETPNEVVPSDFNTPEDYGQFREDMALYRDCKSRAQPEAVTNAGDVNPSEDDVRMARQFLWDYPSMTWQEREKILSTWFGSLRRKNPTAEAELARAREVIQGLIEAHEAEEEWLKASVPDTFEKPDTGYLARLAGKAGKLRRSSLTTARKYLEWVSEFEQRTEQKGNE